eukprot:5283504-Pyramimonas_sp.AAC.1
MPSNAEQRQTLLSNAKHCAHATGNCPPIGVAPGSVWEEGGGFLGPLFKSLRRHLGTHSRAGPPPPW